MGSSSVLYSLVPLKCRCYGISHSRIIGILGVPFRSNLNCWRLNIHFVTTIYEEHSISSINEYPNKSMDHLSIIIYSYIPVPRSSLLTPKIVILPPWSNSYYEVQSLHGQCLVSEIFFEMNHTILGVHPFSLEIVHSYLHYEVLSSHSSRVRRHRWR